VEIFEENPDRAPVLVLVPSVGMVKQWVAEASKFTYGLRIIAVEAAKVCNLLFYCPASYTSITGYS